MVPALFVWAALAIAAPFEDVQQRFHLDLPKGWQFAPLPGDTGGATFRRASDGVYVNAMIRVMPFNEEVDLQTFVERIAVASTGEPGYRQLLAKRDQVAGLPGYHRRFLTLVNGDPHMPKMAEQRMLVHDRTGYVVHAETLADAFPLFEADIQALMRSFALGPIAQKKSEKPRHLHQSDLLGAWRSDRSAHRVELSPGGSITLDDAHGVYHVDQGTLVADIAGKKHIFALDYENGHLQLSGGVFAEGETFTKQRATSTAQRLAPAHRAGKRPAPNQRNRRPVEPPAAE